MVAGSQGSEDGLETGRLPTCQVTDQHQGLIAEPAGALQKETLHVGRDGFAVVPPFKIGRYASQNGIDGQALIHIVTG